ncbi:hypothetical protein [Lysinibacillus piscis]|uniref:DUF2178 domain-containing protein n=1 Tax=Lysinibacillus piscis TaxID=2518931 RepID=A0ABQ5NL24_9BACI|nr:hypothetical protein [Lysinibacillus sp. KH24]GLC89003.1 hypothetical protein LYSBPC_21300 [Lysinibacillus sp. KH24]
MKIRIWMAMSIAIATLLVIGYAIFKGITGREVGFNEIISIAGLLMLFFSMLTWGSKEDKDGILAEEELGQRIIEKSSKISYFLLIAFIMLAVVADKMVNGTMNIFLVSILGLALITLPFVEFVMAKKYR